jgi:hypothetical protein
MVGAVLILVTMVVVGPIAVMMAGAVWSAIEGWSLIDDAERRADGAEAHNADA